MPQPPPSLRLASLVAGSISSNDCKLCQDGKASDVIGSTTASYCVDCGTGMHANDDHTSCISNIQWEVWDDLGGDSISDLISDPSYPDLPKSSSVLDSDYFDVPSPSNVGDLTGKLGYRITGYFLVPESGNYTFKVVTGASGAAQLSLNGEIIASPDSKMSKLIYLTDGSVYELFVVSTSSFEVGTTLPSGMELSPFPSSQFLPQPTTSCATGNGNTWDGLAWNCSSCREGEFTQDYLCVPSCAPGRYSSINECKSCEPGKASNIGESARGAKRSDELRFSFLLISRSSQLEHPTPPHVRSALGEHTLTTRPLTSAQNVRPGVTVVLQTQSQSILVKRAR